MSRFLFLITGLSCGFAAGYWASSPTDSLELLAKNPAPSYSATKPVDLKSGDPLFSEILRKDMDKALQLIVQASSSDRVVLLREIYSYLNELNEANDDGKLSAWLAALDSHGVGNTLIQRFWSRVYWRKGRSMESLEQLSTALAGAVSDDEIDAINEDAGKLVSQIISQYEQSPTSIAQSDYEALLVFAQQHFNDLLSTSLALAKFYQSLRRYQDALNALQFLPYDEIYNARVEERIALIEELVSQQEKSKLGIPLEVVRGQYIVRVNIGDVTNVPLLLDTGASYTSFDRDFIRELEYSSGVISDPIRQVTVNTANGSALAELYELDSFQLGHENLKSLTVLSVDMGGFSSAVGLLGMNVLDQFQFEIDQQNKRLFLKPKP